MPIHPDNHAFAFESRIPLLSMQEMMEVYPNLMLVEKRGNMRLMKD